MSIVWSVPVKAEKGKHVFSSPSSLPPLNLTLTAPVKSQTAFPPSFLFLPFSTFQLLLKREFPKHSGSQEQRARNK